MIDRLPVGQQRDIAPELEFPELEQYNEYLRASRVYVNRAGAVPSEQIERFEGILVAEDEGGSVNDGPAASLLGSGLNADNLVGGDKVAHTLGLLRSVVGL